MNRTARAAIGLAAIATFAVSGCGSDSKTVTTPAPAGSQAPAATTGGSGSSAAPETSTPSVVFAVCRERRRSIVGPAATAAPAGSNAPAAGAATITIKDFKYEIPSGLKAGEKVTITNGDKANHTFSDKDGKFDVKVDAGQTAEFTLPAAGTYSIICKIHPSMSGELTVG